MKVTAKADYAVRAVLELGAADGGLVKADRIAEAQGIPRHFLDNILTDLRRAGIVATQRGAEGGSRLARPGEGRSRSPTSCAPSRGRSPRCATSARSHSSYDGAAERLPEVWIAVRAALRDVLEQVTVADVVAGSLPRPIERLIDDPEAWKTALTGVDRARRSADESQRARARTSWLTTVGPTTPIELVEAVYARYPRARRRSPAAGSAAR